jgi:hypothetical protein
MAMNPGLVHSVRRSPNLCRWRNEPWRPRQYNEALASLKEADKIDNKTPYEEALLEQLRLVAAIGAQEPATAAKAFDALRARFLADAQPED